MQTMMRRKARWGTFKLEAIPDSRLGHVREIHVAPIDRHHQTAHWLGDVCFCDFAIEVGVSSFLVIHEEQQ